MSINTDGSNERTPLIPAVNLSSDQNGITTDEEGEKLHGLNGHESFDARAASHRHLFPSPAALEPVRLYIFARKDKD